ncbi:site-specific integrase [Alkalihalobacillus sp. 1P02AB]|uniref:site-specific integrase n=1 Tax=Alkalihalobacillus sp. 1P02AB TaxID=3132260 RepID=UPI0039A75D60
MTDTTNISLSNLIEQATLYLNELNYSEGTLYRYRLKWKHLQTYAKTKNEINFSLELGKAFLSDNYGIEEGMRLTSSEVFIVRCIKVLEEFRQHKLFHKCHQPVGRQVPDQFSPILNEYFYLQKDRQFSKRTIQGKQIQIIHFLCFLDEQKIIDINHLVPYDVLAYLDSLSNYSSSTKTGIMFTLREFLAFLVSKRYISHQLDQLFPVIFSNKFERIPSYYSIEEIHKILLEVDRNTEIGRRDYIVLILAVQLGMRAGDIKHLKFENIRWHLDTIEFIQEKTKNPLQLPLTENLKFALIDYMKNSRPSSNDPHIFIRHRAPFTAFSTGHVFWSTINKYMDTSGITINNRKHGLHSLRHSLASNLLKQNTPFPVITGVLGHENSNTTKLYLRIDIEQLRSVALEVPYER